VLHIADNLLESIVKFFQPVCIAMCFMEHFLVLGLLCDSLVFMLIMRFIIIIINIFNVA